MLFHDENLTGAMTAGGRKAERAGGTAGYGQRAPAAGSAGRTGPVGGPGAARRGFPGRGAVRDALERSLDDLPYLERLGIDLERVLSPAGAHDPRGTSRRPAATPTTSGVRCTPRP